MATPIKYIKPRRINVVSVTLLLAVVIAGYAAYLYLPLYFMRHEAYRVLEETGSEVSVRGAFYMQDSPARDELRKKMQCKIKDMGVDDPNIETWIEFEGKEAHLGVVYSAWVEWPFGLVERQETLYELEHTLIVH